MESTRVISSEYGRFRKVSLRLMFRCNSVAHVQVLKMFASFLNMFQQGENGQVGAAREAQNTKRRVPLVVPFFLVFGK